MNIQILCSDAVREKLIKCTRKTSINITDDAKVALVERGYPLEDGKISIVFDGIDYDEVIELLSTSGDGIDLEDQTIIGFSNNRYALLELSKIDYIEAQGTQVSCFVHEEVFVVKKTLSHYESELKGVGIVRINKSQLVNIRNVKEIIPWFNSRLVFVLESGKELEVSKLYSKTIRKMLNL